MENCSCVAEDVAKIFEVYWYLGVPHTPVPPAWPAKYDTSFNKDAPMSVLLNATKSSVYVSVGSLHRINRLAAGVGRAFSRVCLSVCLFVCPHSKRKTA